MKKRAVFALILCVLVLSILSAAVIANDRYLKQIDVKGPGFAKADLKNPPFNPQDGKGWEKLDKGEIANYFVQDTRMAIVKIEFALSKKVDQPSIAVYALLTLPDFLPQVELAYQYNQVKYTNFDKDDLDGIYYYFVVEKQWLSDIGATGDDVVFYKYVHKYEGGSWEPEDIRLIHENQEYFFYKTYSKGADYFVITALVDQVSNGSVEYVQYAEEGAEITGEVVSEIESVQERQPEYVPVADSVQGHELFMFIFGLIVVIFAIVLVSWPSKTKTKK